MPIYEGLVAGLKENGKAEVTIAPRSQCIPGAPEVTERVCHTQAESSTFVIEALNNASADVGDLVSVSRTAAALVKNALLLLGMPLLGLGLGIIAAFLITQVFAISLAAGIGTVIICFLTGLGLGVRAFKRSGEGGTPVVESIIRTRKELEEALKGSKGPTMDRTMCQTCPGFVPNEK